MYSIGRRWEGIHQSLLQAASRKEIFYIYDTASSADTPAYSHQQHRSLFANVTKRSRCFVVAPAMMNAPQNTHGQIEVGYRYYEGSAAGAVLIGQTPENRVFGEMFPWPDAVVHIQPDGSDVMEVLARLAAEPDRISEISRRNIAGALLRHDWVYRWKEMFRVAGIAPSQEMLARERRLKHQADLAANTPPDGTAGHLFPTGAASRQFQ